MHAEDGIRCEEWLDVVKWHYERVTGEVVLYWLEILEKCMEKCQFGG